MDVRKLAREIVEGSAVLLKNEGELLPLAPETEVAFFGRAQVDTVLSGSGSGAAAGGQKTEILAACERAGLKPVPALAAFYREQSAKAAADQPAPDFDLEKLKDLVNSGLMYEIFGKYTPPAEEFPLSPELLAQAAEATDTAVLILGRGSGGEECDRHYEDDYLLTAAERALVEQVAGAFPKVAVILNINGLMDLSWLERCPNIRSVLFLGVPGEEGPVALANLLTGRAVPSGKLAVTIARRYEDYPAAEHFSWDKDHPEALKTYEDYGLSAAENGSVGFVKSPVTLYREDIYLGYRYADTFGVKPLFPFGFGLSYTSFAITPSETEKTGTGITVSARVTNTGETAGREVVQLYVSAQGETPRPAQELKAFVKTAALDPGHTETVRLTVPWRELACWSETAGAFVIERGKLLFRLGNSSAETVPVCEITVAEDVPVQPGGDLLGLRPCNQGKLDFLTGPRLPLEPAEETLTLTAADVAPETAPELPAVPLPALTTEELAALCVGYGPGTPFAGLGGGEDPATIFTADGKPLTTNSHPTGVHGYVSPAIAEKGIRSVYYKDGPAGVGGIAWPTEMLLACGFDTALCERFGDAVGQECEEIQADVWLAPAVNLHRHPLGGRNFEYLSEDPFLSGTLACAMARGCQENHPVLVCAKHFAVNEQETYRRGSAKKKYDAVDSILTPRAARELYLKPFEMLVRHGGLRCVMTSFNKINGTFAGGSADLCTRLLREEWGFDGLVVTDWGDMDTVVDGADAVAAGNDVVMPGGPPVIAQILQGLAEGRVTRPQLETAVGHLLGFLARLGRYESK